MPGGDDNAGIMPGEGGGVLAARDAGELDGGNDGPFGVDGSVPLLTRRGRCAGPGRVPSAALLEEMDRVAGATLLEEMEELLASRKRGPRDSLGFGGGRGGPRR